MFEHSLIALDKKKSSRRRWLSFPIAVGLHLVALASFTFASYWHVEQVPEPMEAGIYQVEVELPALQQAKIKLGRPAPVAEHKAQVEAPRPAIAQPEEPKDTKLPTVPTPPSIGILLADAPIGPGHPDGDKDGDTRGSIHGILGVPFDPNAEDDGGGRQKVAVPASDEPIRVFGAVTRPVVIDGPQPRYTEAGRHAGVQGTVIVEAVINEQGRVTAVRILKTLPMGLDQAAADAVRSWRFKPSTLAGKAVKVFYTLTVNFTLQR
jgi:protein TonB